MPRPPLAETRASLADQVIAADRLLNRIIRARDAAAAALLFEDDYLYTCGNGVFKTKADMLAGIANREVRLLVSEVQQPRVLLRGNVAVLMGRLVEQGTAYGLPLDARLQVTDIWVRRGGSRWRLLAGHASPLACGQQADPSKTER